MMNKTVTTNEALQSLNVDQQKGLSDDQPFHWLNENSRKFLSAGYLTEGVSPEERIKEIALRAESILEIEGFADKFYKYMGEGYYSLASPVWSNFGKERGLPISCFGSHVDDDMGNDNLDNIIVSAKDEGLKIHEIGHHKSVVIVTRLE